MTPRPSAGPARAGFLGGASAGAASARVGAPRGASARAGSPRPASLHAGASRAGPAGAARLRQKGGFALGLVVGLLLGLAAALAVALYVTKTPVPLMVKGQQRTPEQDAAETERNKTWDPNAALAGRAITRPAAPAPVQPASDTVYVARGNAPVLPTAADNGRVSALPGNPAPSAVVHSTRDAAAILNGNDSDPKSVASVAAGGDPFIYFVQVGAYSRPEDAEQQRARLALAGFRATISEREQNGRTVHRVRLGPFDRKEDADAQQERARAVDPDASLVRLERSKQ